MSNLIHSSPGLPQLVMLMEPETKIRFRYASEGGSHGVLKGSEKKTFPTVKLLGYNGKKPVYVKVRLYTEDKEEHVFEFKGKSDERLPFIKEYLQDNDTAVFNNLKILSKKRDEIFQQLMDQKLKKLKITCKTTRVHLEKGYEKEVKERAKQILNSLRLCFEAFEEGTRDICLCDPLFSNVICNQKAASKGDLIIARMSKYAGSCMGGDEVILLCNKVDKDTIKIEFFETNGCDEIVWREPAVFSKADVHYQVAITFRTPQYKSSLDTEKKVFVCLVRDEERSEPREFIYTPNFAGNPSKRKRYDNGETWDNALQNDMLHVESSYESSSNSNDISESLENRQDQVDFPMETINIAEACDFLNLNVTEFNEIAQEYPLPADDLIYPPDAMNVYTPERLYNQSLQIDGIVGQMGIQELKMDQMDGALSMKERNCDYESLKSSPWNPNQKAKEILVEAQMGMMELKMNDLGIKERDCDYKSLKSLVSNPNEKAKKIRAKIGSYLMRRDASGNTLLHLALFENKDISVILKGCELADRDVINIQNFHRETALLLATKLNNVEAVKILLQYNSNPNLKDDEGNNCYHLAALNNSSDAMYYLLSLAEQMQINDFNYQGLTPLHLAIVKNSVECFHLLKIHGADLNVVEQKSGRSLLHYAVKFQPSFVPVLLGIDAQFLDVQDFEGNRPLHIACATGNIKVVKQLVEKGADPLLRNFKETEVDSEENSEDFGQTPANLTTNLEILEVLKKSSRKVSESSKIIKKLGSLLDVDDKWKTLAFYFVDPEFIDSLQCSSSPSEALLAYIEKECKENFIECLTNGLEITGLNDALDIVKEKHL